MLKSILAIFARNQIPSVRQGASHLARYGSAVLSVTVALAAAVLLRHYNLPHPFTSFSFAAIAIAFWYAGTGPGVLAAVLSYATLTVLFVPVKVGSLFWAEPTDWTRFAEQANPAAIGTPAGRTALRALAEGPYARCRLLCIAGTG